MVAWYHRRPNNWCSCPQRRTHSHVTCQNGNKNPPVPPTVLLSKVFHMIISPSGLTKLILIVTNIQNSSSNVWPQSAFMHFLAMHTSIHFGRKFYHISQSWFVDTLVGSNQQRPLSRFVLIVFAITDSVTLPPVLQHSLFLASILCSRKNCDLSKHTFAQN